MPAVSRPRGSGRMSTPSTSIGPFGHVVEAADQVDQRALARAAVADQADHLARGDIVRSSPRMTAAVAVAEAHAAQLDGALRRGGSSTGRLGLGHAGNVVQNVEDALGPGGRLLREGHDAAHRVQPRVEAPDVGEEGRQHAHGDVAPADLPDTEGPHDQQADFGQQGDGGREQRPDFVDAVVDLQVAHVASRKRWTSRFSWAKALTTRIPGMVSASTLVTSGPHAVHLLEAVAQAVAHEVDHPHDEGQRQQRDQREARVDGEEDGRRHGDHQHVGGEIQQMQREEQADAVGLAADARHEVAGALAAEVLQRQVLQVRVGGDAQVGADALADQRQHVGARPAQAPRRAARRPAGRPGTTARPGRNRWARRSGRG